MVLAEGDVLFLQGPEEGIDMVRELSGAEPYNLAPPVENKKLSNLDRAVDILIEMKNITEVAVGLAYSAVLFADTGLAREVSGLEDRCDDLYYDLQRWVLRTAADVPDEELDELRALLEIGLSSERIADAAQEMTRLAEAEDDPHPVVSVALRETDEIVADAIVAQGAAAERKTMKDLSLETETGMYVLAIQRDGRWIYRPRGSRLLEAGDRLLATGPVEGVALLRNLLGDTRPPSEDH